MKQQLRNIANKLARKPVIGRLVRTSVAIFKLPETPTQLQSNINDVRSTLLEMNHVSHLKQNELEGFALDINHRVFTNGNELVALRAELQHAQQRFDEFQARQLTFFNEQLPTIVNNVAQINQRQLASDADKSNLVNSVPVALRKLTRDVLDLNESAAKQHKLIALEAELQHAHQRFDEFQARQLTFFNEQLPNLITNVAQINQRQLASDTDKANLVNSVPVALRKLTRDVLDLNERTAKQLLDLNNSTAKQQLDLNDNTAKQQLNQDNLTALSEQLKQNIESLNKSQSNFTKKLAELNENLIAQNIRHGKDAQQLSDHLNSNKGQQDKLTKDLHDLQAKQSAHFNQTLQATETQILNLQASLEAKVQELNQQHNEQSKSLSNNFEQAKKHAEILTLPLVQQIAVSQQQIMGSVTPIEQKVNQLYQDLSLIKNEINQQSALVKENTQAFVQPTIAQVETHQQQLSNHNNSLHYLLGRVEFVRRELMFEMRYGAGAETHKELSLTEAKIIAIEKLKKAKKSQLKINLGCGHIIMPDYINVDRRELPGIDIVAEVSHLPFQKAEVDEIYSAHLLEHFPLEELKRSLLPYFYGLLKAGGTFRAVVPDAEAMTQHLASGDYAFEHFREVMYGSQDYDGDFHFNAFTPASLQKLLEEAHFQNIQIIAKGRQNGLCYEFEIHGKK